MYIAPNSTIKLLKNVPLDASYDHTVYFSSKTQQRNWFDGYVKPGMVFEKQYYQRHSRDYIKLEVLADNVYDCNYIMFRNTSFGTKWFYAFITNVEYVNNNVTLIQYQIDAMQTWHFDYTLGECFVEREHSASDDIGENLVPEDVATGELMYAGEDVLLNYDMQSTPNEYDLCVVVAAPFGKNGGDSNGTITGGMYSGLYYNVFSSYVDSNNQVHTLLDQLTDFFNTVRVQVRQDQIVTMFYYIKQFAVQDGSVDTPNRAYHQEYKTFNKDFSGFKNNYNDSSETQYYIPKNNKLFTAPYNYLTVTDFEGHEADYAYEYFGTYKYQFCLKGGLTTTPAIAFIPCAYMGYGSIWYDPATQNDSGTPNLDYSFWYKDFPKIPWNTDGFIAWLAQAGVAFAASTVPSLLGLASGGVGGMLATNNMLGETNHAISVANTLSGGSEALQQGYSVGGSPSRTVSGLLASGAVAALRGRKIGGYSNPSPNWCINNIRISAIHKKIRRDYAERIDSYFSMYGYATRKLKIPNTAVRTCWTYTKTAGCNMTKCNVPADDAKLICSLYDRGITFWMSTATVGDYSQANNVLI